MPIVSVPMNMEARAAYLDVYKADAIETVNAHMRAIWDRYQRAEPWVQMVYLHRAVEGYAYLNDPDRAENLLTRYPTVARGIPSYGANHDAVAAAYVEFNNQYTAVLVADYEDHRHTIEGIPAQVDKPQVDTLVNAFVIGHPVGGAQ